MNGGNYCLKAQSSIYVNSTKLELFEKLVKKLPIFKTK